MNFVTEKQFCLLHNPFKHRYMWWYRGQLKIVL